jgi:hypothetical protein
MWTASDHLFQLVIMLVVILSAQAIARRAHRKRVLDEIRRLRVALAIVLAALRELYEDDLAILARGELAVISGRNRINLLRTQLTRLTSLETSEVEALMTACVAAECVETDMAIYGKKIGGVAYTIFSGKEARPTLESRLRESCAALLAAEELLRPPGALPLARPTDATPGREPVADTSRAHI